MNNETTLKAGPIVPALVKLSLPVMVGQLFNLLYNLVDTYFIALLDPKDPYLVGATGMVFPLMILFWAVGFGISSGTASLVARAIGAGRSRDLDRTAESGLVMGLIASVVFLGLMYPFSEGLLKVFGASGVTLAYANQYLVWLLPMVPFLFMSSTFMGILQGEGRTKHLMISMIAGTVVNIILDPLLMFTAGMGLAGAGLATAIGNAVGAVYLLVVLVKSQAHVRIHWRLSHVSLPVVGEILRVGLPQSLMNLLMSLSFLFYNRMITDLNPVLLSSFTLYSRLEQIALIPIFALSNGLATLAGQAAGARDFTRFRQSYWQASALAAGVSGVLLIVFVALSPWLFALFQSNAEVLSLANQIAPWMAATTFLAAPIFLANTSFAAAGFANRGLGLTALRIYGLNIPGAYIAAYLVGRSVEAVMASLLISAVLATVITLLVVSGFFRRLDSGKLAVRQAPAGFAVPVAVENPAEA